MDIGKDGAAVAKRSAKTDVIIDIAVEHFQPAATLRQAKLMIGLVKGAFVEADDHDNVAPDPLQPAVHYENTVIVPRDRDAAVFAAKSRVALP